MTRNASALTKSAVSLALASVLSFSVFAQDSSVSEKFVDIDVMIQNLKTVSGQDGTVSKQPEVLLNLAQQKKKLSFYST